MYLKLLTTIILFFLSFQSAFSNETFSSGATHNDQVGNWKGPYYYRNPYPNKFVSDIDVWGYCAHPDGYINILIKDHNSYGPMGTNETVSIKLTLPESDKTVTATRVDVLGQVLPTNVLHYELSDGSGTASGLPLWAKNNYGLSHNPTSLTLNFNCPSISTVTVRFWVSE